MATCGTGGWSGPLPGDPDNNSVLTATPAFGGIDVSFSYPATNPHAVAFARLYRGTTPDFEAAVLHRTMSGNFYYDKISTSAQYWYWIQIVSVNGTVGDVIGPATATARPLIADLIEQLTGAIDSGVLAQSLKSDIDRITLNYNELTSRILGLSGDDAALADALAGVQQGISDALVAVVAETNNRVSGQNAMIEQIDAIAAVNQDNAAAIAVNNQASVSRDEANAARIEEVFAAVNESLSAAVQTLSQAIVSQDTGAFAQQLTDVQAQLNDQISSVQLTLQTNINTVGNTVTQQGALFTAKVGVNGLVGGFAVFNDGTEVEAGFDVDRFWVGRTGNDLKKPFVIQDGEVFINEAVIESLTINKLRDESGRFVVEDGSLAIRDAAGNIIFSAGTPLDWSRVTGANKPQDGATRNVFRGEWAPAVAYSVGDIVMEAGYGWASRTNHVSSASVRPPVYPVTQNTNWSVFSIKGDPGVAGANGTRTAVLDMYRNSAAAPTTFPSGNSTYTWANGQFTAPATPNGWSLTPPNPVAGQDLWVIRQLYSDNNTSATSVVAWTSTTPRISAASGEPGADGANGARTAFAELYQWSVNAPTVFPAGTSTYTWATGAFTAPTTPNGWSLVPGAHVAGQTLWACSVRLTNTNTGATDTLTWNTSTAYAVGAAGANGINGTRTAVLDLYRWSAAAPTTFAAGNSTYTWATGQFTAPGTLNGWSLTPPAPVQGQTLWMLRQIYADSGSSATSTVAWTANSPRSMSIAGVNGVRTAFLEVYRWSADSPTTFPAGSSVYTWANGTFTNPTTLNGWSLIPGAPVPGQTLWGCSVSFADTGTSTTSNVPWNTTNAYALGAAGTDGTDGRDGLDGDSAKQVYLAASSQIFRISKTGVATPTLIVLTATGQNLSGSPVFTVSAGTGTLTGSGSIRSLAYADMVTDSVTVTVTWDSMVDTITIVKVREGTDGVDGSDGADGLNGLTIVLSNEAHTLPASTSGTVSSYAGSGTTVQVFEGGTALSASATGVVSAFRIGAITQVPAATLTPGDVSYAGSIATLAQHSAMVVGTHSAVLNIPITIYRANGTSITVTKIQTLTKSLAGAQGIQGLQGLQGIPGTPGADGVTYYTWVKYADSPTTGMSDFPAGKAYLGIAYNKLTAEESTVYSDYTWALIKGTDGQEGPPGADGVTTYTWIRYADNASGAGMSDSPTGKMYIGIAVNRTTATESNTATDYTWSLIQGPAGANAVQAILSNEVHVMPAQTSGAITSYANSGTELRVYEGSTLLAYDGLGNANGTWGVTATSTNITPGAVSNSGLFATFAAVSGMSPTSDTAAITFAITGRTAAGAVFNITKTQTFSKSRTGNTGAQGPIGPSVLLVSNRPASFTSTDGVLDPAQTNLVLTANTTGISNPTYAWTFSGLQTNPVASTTNSQTITAANFGVSSSAIVTVTVNGTIVDKMTIVRLEKSTAAPGATVGGTIGENINGQITPENVSTFIANAAINTAQVGQLDADVITAGTLRAGIIDVQKLIGSSTAFNTPGFGSFTVPPGMTRLAITAWGAGGGGGGGGRGSAGWGDDSGSYPPVNGGPGGVGGRGGSYRAVFDVTPGQVISFNLGYGGAGGAGSAFPGNGTYNGYSGAPGGQSTFTIAGATFSAEGGGGGTGGVGGNPGSAGTPGAGGGGGSAGTGSYGGFAGAGGPPDEYASAYPGGAGHNGQIVFENYQTNGLVSRTEWENLMNHMNQRLASWSWP